MTRQQIAESLGRSIVMVHDAFFAAIKEHPELEKERPNNKDSIDYTLEQVLLAMSYARKGRGISEIEKQIITEDFTMREPEKVKAKGIKGTEEFLAKIKLHPKKKCCSTCIFLIKSTMRNRKPVPKPYCTYWSRYLHRINANPYEDYCKQWEFSNRKPLIFYTHDSPTNIDIYGNVKTDILGYDMKMFGKKSDGGTNLVTDIGINTDLSLFNED